MQTRYCAKMRYVPGAADLRIQQPFDEPYLHLRVERTKAEELGFTAHDIAQNLLVSLSGSFQTSPTFWVDPKTACQLSNCNPNPGIPDRHPAGSGKHSSHGNKPSGPTIDHGQPGFYATGNRHGDGFSLQRGAGDGHLRLGVWS